MSVLTIQLSGELLEKAKKQAAKEERNTTNLVRWALKKYINDAAEPAKVPAAPATSPA